MAEKEFRKALGRARKIYRGASVTWSDLVFRALPGALAPLVFLGCGTYARMIGVGQPALGRDSASIWYLLAALALIPFVIFTLRRFATSRQAVVLYSNGLRFLNIPAVQSTLLWRQIRSLRSSGTRYHFFGLRVADRHHMTIETFHGDAIELPDHLQDMPELAEWIKKEVYPLRLPAIEEELAQDRAVDWGPITTDRNWLGIPRETISWDKISAMRVDSGQLIVEIDESPALRFPAGEIHNLELLLRVADRMVSGQNPSSHHNPHAVPAHPQE